MKKDDMRSPMLCIISAKSINNYIVHEELLLSFQCFHAINVGENDYYRGCGRGYANANANDYDLYDHDHDDYGHDGHDHDDHDPCDRDFPYILHVYVYYQSDYLYDNLSARVYGLYLYYLRGDGSCDHAYVWIHYFHSNCFWSQPNW